uniref:Photosystem I reaction center subunit II, chloroplastic n=1 Tax=Oryza brachyantha TaxID=4533 RepID=J3LM63_ORYBR
MAGADFDTNSTHMYACMSTWHWSFRRPNRSCGTHVITVEKGSENSGIRPSSASPPLPASSSPASLAGVAAPSSPVAPYHRRHPLSTSSTLLPLPSPPPPASTTAPWAAAATEEKKVEAPKGFVPPQLDPNTPSPIFGGSTGGLLRKAQVEEFYVITWTSPKEQVFEMPTGGAAIMREGPNLLKLARKEQCLALGTRLRSKYKINYQFYRVFPNGEVQYLHPKDSVYPEKVNTGRQGVGQNFCSIGKNVSPIKVKFTGKNVFDI